MRYSIGQVAKKLGLTAHTLRYYDKEGLLPFVRKGSSGARVFEDEDVDWLIIIECLKGTGMQLKDIKKYMDLCQQGDATVGERHITDNLLTFQRYWKDVFVKMSAKRKAGKENKNA